MHTHESVAGTDIPLKSNLLIGIQNIPGNCSRCTHLRNMMAKAAALGQGFWAKK